MITKCPACPDEYDDARCSTICPHPLLMSIADMDRKDAAVKLLGKQVRFSHQPEGPYWRVACVGWRGGVSIDGSPGTYSPRSFVEREPEAIPDERLQGLAC